MSEELARALEHNTRLLLINTSAKDRNTRAIVEQTQERTRMRKLSTILGYACFAFWTFTLITIWLHV